MADEVDVNLAWSRSGDVYIGSTKMPPNDTRVHYVIRVLGKRQFHLSGGPESIKRWRPLGTFDTVREAKTYARKDLKYQQGLDRAVPPESH